MPEKITLGDYEFRAIKIYDLTQSAKTPEHRVEEQFSIVDHVILQPAEFRLELELVEDEIGILMSLFESKEPVELITDFGIYEDMVIKNLEITPSSSTTKRASVQLKQIRKAITRTATVPFTTDLPVTQDESTYPGSKTAVSPYKQEVPQAPEKQENKSWVDSIFDFFGGLFG